MQKLKVYWFGYGGHSHIVEQFRPMIESLDMELITIHEHDNANIKWDRNTWLNELNKADIIILPCNYEIQDAKSNNKLTQALSLKKPVICSPLPAYVEILNKYPNSFLIAYDKNDWEKYLNILKDKNERDKLSIIGYDISKNYSIDNIGNKWVSLFENQETIDLIIPTYNNLQCLKLLLNSINNCNDLYTNLNIIVVDASSNDETCNYLNGNVKISYIKSPNTSFSKTVNKGLKLSKAKYICILNDDIIVSKNWTKYLLETCKSKNGIIGCLSNCDYTWRHKNSIVINNIELLPGVNTLSQISPIINDIETYTSPYNDVLETSWNAFYCVMFSRELFLKVGYLDEVFVNSGEDVDYCYRANKLGFKCYLDFRSFVFHFGATSRKIAENENYEKYHLEQNETSNYLHSKYENKTVVIYSGLSWEKWDFNNIENGGIGGSETWVVYLSRELKKLGYRVIVFADCLNDLDDNGIQWYQFTKFKDFCEQNFIDYFISSRTTETFDFNIRSDKNYVMIHDIWILGGNKINIHLDKVTKYVVLSEWHKNFVSSYHNIPLDKIDISFNGIDFKRFENKNIERNKYRLIYSSSPDRGLDTLLYLFNFIKNEIPELELHIFYGFDGWIKSAKYRNDNEALKYIENLQVQIKNTNGVFYHGRIGQDELANEFMKSSLLAYPTDFEETFCITAIEAQAAGLPVISSNYAGLITTINDSGILIGNGNKGESYTKDYRIKFVEKCVNILKDKKLWEEYSKKGLSNSSKYSWENVANYWHKLFLE